MDYQQHTASGSYLLSNFYTETVRLVNYYADLGILPEELKKELDSIWSLYEPGNPYNKEVADKLYVLSDKLKQLSPNRNLNS